jgi:vanillate O-demethylase ferredoxin subunit
VSSIKPVALDTCLFELSSLGVEPLPAAAPGAHIDVYLARGVVRQYSVLTPLCGPTSYVIAVKLEAAGRGGSRRMHEEFTVGSPMRIGGPRNNFPLDESAADTLLLAGGIGITPILGMLERLRVLDRKVHLHYWSRSPERALFRERIEQYPDCTLHYSVAGRTTLRSVVQDADAECELYCCGPTRMLQEFVDATTSRPPRRLHLERFSLPPSEEPSGEFTVVLAKSGTEVLVRDDQTILGVLREACIDVSYSCEEGVCGACEVRYLAGVPLHRDAVRTAAEHDRLSTVMICCARSRSKRLTLDL